MKQNKMSDAVRKALGTAQVRHLKLDENTRNINEDERTVEVAFSSEHRVDRWFGVEILDHSPESVRLGRFESGGAVLVGHNHDDHVGVIESVRIDEDRIGRAVVRFGKSARAEEIFQDVKDGIRRFISVGYRIHRVEETIGEGNAPDEYRATDWEPYEVSFVSVPADPDVGVGRDASQTSHDVEIKSNREAEPAAQEDEPEKTRQEESLMKDKEKENTAPAVADSKRAVEQERARVRAISELGSKFGLGEAARKAIDSDTPLSKFQDEVMAKIENDDSMRSSKAHLDMKENEMQRYDLFAAIRAAQSGDWSQAGFERELSEEIERQVGREAQGFYIPADIQARTMSVGGAGVGAELVGTDHLAGSFIDTLRAKSVLGQTGATYLTGLVGNVDIPRRSGDGDTYWLTEDQDVTDSDQITGTVAMSPKTIATSVPLTRRLLKQSSPAAQALVLSGLAANMALGIDKAALVGSGAAGQPRGIINQTGINAVTLAAAGQPTWAELVSFETAVEEAEALLGSLHYVTTPAIKGWLKTKSKDTGSGRFLMEGSEANGYNVVSTTKLPTNGLLFGNFEDIVIGMWGVLDVAPDAAAKAASGGLVLRCFQDVDVAVRNAVSFAYGNVI